MEARPFRPATLRKRLLLCRHGLLFFYYLYLPLTQPL